MGTAMEQGWWVHLTKAWSTDRAMVGPTYQLHSTDLQDLLEGLGWPHITKCQVDRPIIWAHSRSVTLHRLWQDVQMILDVHLSRLQ